MSYFLAKSEPQTYSIEQLRADRQTLWDGVKNAQALQAIRTMLPGDRVFFYHSGGQSAIVGLAEVIGTPRADPSDEKLSVFDLKYLAHLEPPTTLTEIKGSGLFGDWSLLRQSRLSTMRAPDDFVDWMRARYPRVSI